MRSALVEVAIFKQRVFHLVNIATNTSDSCLAHVALLKVAPFLDIADLLGNLGSEKLLQLIPNNSAGMLVVPEFVVYKVGIQVKCHKKGVELSIGDIEDLRLFVILVKLTGCD